MIPLMKNAFINEFETKQALAEFIIKTPKLSMDEKCAEFEVEFSKKQGRKFGVLFNSGGSANLAMLQALKNLGKLKDGDKVGFSALTWSTNTMPIIQMGLVPVPIDCELETLNVMSLNLSARLRDVKLQALFITNVLGFTGDLDNIKKICDENEIILLEDNCESLGSELTSGVKAGNYSLGSTFSFLLLIICLQLRVGWCVVMMNILWKCLKLFELMVGIEILLHFNSRNGGKNII